jgi:hypothetical protein
MDPAPLVLTIVLPLLWLAFSAWTWIRLGFSGLFDRERRRRLLGTYRWGLAMWITMSVWNAARNVDGPLFSLEAAGMLLLMLMVTFPIWMWGGYGFARAMGAVFPHADPRAR